MIDDVEHIHWKQIGVQAQVPNCEVPGNVEGLGEDFGDFMHPPLARLCAKGDPDLLCVMGYYTPHEEMGGDVRGTHLVAADCDWRLADEHPGPATDLRWL